MADEKKKPWQFSLGRMLGAMTMICVTLAVSITPFSSNFEIVRFFGLFISSMGLGAAVGIIWGGMRVMGVFALIGIWLAVLGYYVALKLGYYLVLDPGDFLMLFFVKVVIISMSPMGLGLIVGAAVGGIRGATSWGFLGLAVGVPICFVLWSMVVLALM